MAQNAHERATEDATDSQEQNRPQDCMCRGWSTSDGLPCWPCSRDGFEEPAEWTVKVGDRVKADWSEGGGAYDEIVGIVVEKSHDLIVVDIDYDDDCAGGDTVHYGKHDCAPEWIAKVEEVNAYDPSELRDNEDNEDDEDGEDDAGTDPLFEDDAETVPEEELDDDTLRALEPERPLDVRELAPQMYEVQSENDTYTVDVADGGRCTCPGYQYHGHCRHVRRVEIVIGEYELPTEPDQMEIDIDPSLGSHLEPNIQVAE
jgi:hypothetical protein